MKIEHAHILEQTTEELKREAHEQKEDAEAELSKV